MARFMNMNVRGGIAPEPQQKIELYKKMKTINICARRAISLIVFALIFSIAFILGPSAASAQKRTPSRHRTHATKKRTASTRSDRDSESTAEITTVRGGKKVRTKLNVDTDRFDQPAEALEAYLAKRLPKGAKTLPIERYFEAKEKIKRMQRFSTRKGKSMKSQAETGGANPDSGFGDGDFPNGTGGGGAGDGSASTSGALGTWQELGPGNVGGRTRALLVDPNNPNVMYAAAVAGGIWKSTNGGTTWAPLDDFLANIAVSSMAFDPTNSSIIYAGTGEGFFNADGLRGAGVFKSIDAGATWTRLVSTANNADFFFVNDIVVSNVNPQHVYAATRSGVMRSLDGGSSWTLVLNVPTVAGSTTGVRGATDLVIRTDQSTDYIFAAAGTAFNPGEPVSHIFRNTDAGGSGTWDDVYSEPNMGRTSLAIAPSNQNVIYAMATTFAAGNYNLGLLGVFRSTNSGAPGTWTTQVRNTSANKQDTLLLSNPVNAALVECGLSATNNFINQGWYDNVLAVDPTDENKVWAGGTDLFRSDNGGVNWGVASYWWFQGNGTPPNNGDPQLVHADNHVIVFHPGYNGTTNQTMFVGDDGGIYKTDNAKVGNVGYVGGITPSGGTITTSSPICGNEFTPGGFFTVPSPVIWGPLNNNYGVTQFYHGLAYPNGQTYFGGTQDNGTNRGTDAAGLNAWERINGGDGGFVAVNPTNTNTLFFETTGLSLRRSTNGGASSASVITGITGDAFPFTTVFRMDPTTPTRLWIGGRFMWRSDNNAANWTRTSNAQQTGGSITAMAIAPGNSNVVIDGAASGQLRRTTTGTTANAASVLNTVWLQTFTPRGNGNGTISWVEYDPSNANNVWATISNFNGTPNAQGTGAGHVFKSTDGGGTWALADGNQTPGNVNAIPDIPAHTVVIDPNDGQRIYVGTDLGVFVSLDGGANWARETTGFSNVSVDSLQTVNTNGVTTLFAFTHGRGAFKVTIPTSCATVSPTTQAFFSPGNSGTVTVTKNLSATAGCDWNAVSNDSFITIDSGSTGSNNGTVGFTVAPNTTSAARTGTLTIAGRTVTINQDAAPVANNDTATTDEDTPVNINVLANDTDPDGDTLSVVSVTQGAHGTVSINADKTVRYTPAQDYFGGDSFTYNLTDGHAQVTATVNVTVNAVNDAPVFTTASPATQTVDYSDPINTINVAVADVDNATSTLTLAVTSTLPAGLTATPGATPGTLTITGNPAVAAGTYNIDLKVTDPLGASSTTTVTVVVTKEKTETIYTGDTSVITSGPTVTTATFRLGAHLVQEADGADGDITLAKVTFQLFKSSNLGTTPDYIVPGVAVTAAGDTVPTTVSNLGEDVYTVKVLIDTSNGYWTASPFGMSTISVTVGTNDQRANGGGWIPDPASINGKSNFGYTVRGVKGSPKGSFILITRGTDGYDYIVRSNSWAGGFLNFATDPGSSVISRASFKGKCNVQKVDSNTGAVVQSWGNFSFAVDTRDGDLFTPRQEDSFAVSIIDNNGLVWRQVGTPASLIDLGGGNVMVKGK